MSNTEHASDRKREKLTPERIRTFTCPDGAKQAFKWDTEAPRLAVRATTGSKSFVFESKLNRRTIRITIGDVRDWVVEDARKKARELQTMVDNGIDPRAAKKERIEAAETEAAKAERAKQPALEVWRHYTEARRHHWKALHAHAHEDAVKTGGEPRPRGKKGKIEPGILRPILAHPLAEITPELVAAWLKQESKTRPTRARGAFALLRAFINWCAEHPDYADIVHADACAASRTKDELPKKRAKRDALLREQLPAWFGAVRSLASPTAAAYLQILLITGARPGELIELRWEDVDWQWRGLTIKDKVSGARTIPLTPFVEALLRDLRERQSKVSTIGNSGAGTHLPASWVFSSSRTSLRRLTRPNATHDRACAKAGIANLTLHGLRRSFGSLSEWCEAPAGVVAQIMGHKPSATAEKHYRVRPLDLLRMWHVRIEGWILEQAGVEQPAEATTGLRVVREA